MTGWPPDDHDELQAYIVEELEHWNWDVDQEVVIDGNRRFRADIICEHEKWGVYGIECKFISTSEGSRLVGKAARQIIHQYRNSTFDGEYISKWVVAPYFEPYDSDNQTRAATHVRPILCALGIGFIDLSLHEYEPDIVFNFSNTRKTKIPAAARPALAFEADVSAIENAIQGKVEYELV